MATKPPIDVDTERSTGQAHKVAIASAHSAAKSRRSIDLKPALMSMIVSYSESIDSQAKSVLRTQSLACINKRSFAATTWTPCQTVACRALRAI